MPTATINGIKVTVEPGTSILQACEQVGVEIPRFCFHDRLSVPANCRMCLVEVEGQRKPIASCAMPLADNMEVKTDTDLVQKARHGVMEFLLINHPLDCPICDQGGECDLQDQAVAYGYDRNRFTEFKRAVKDKELGPLIKTVMNRCIHCTRCVRFADQIAGVSELGMLGRGEEVEIGTFIEQAVTNELSGNMIDICPVGALTSKPYAFKARSWELTKTQSISVMDGVGENIRIDSFGNEVMRVLPVLHEDINEEWISDKTRFSYDGLLRQRLDTPYIRNDQGRLQPASWDDALALVAKKLKKADSKKIAGYVGGATDSEAMLLFKELMDHFKVQSIDVQTDGTDVLVDHRSHYIFNSTIADLERADAVLMIGTNPRWEAPLINARLRKAFLDNNTKFGVVGREIDLGYPTKNFGDGPEILKTIASGRHDFSKVLKAAKAPVILIGAEALTHKDAIEIQLIAGKIAERYGVINGDWNGYNILHPRANTVGGLDLGLIPDKRGKSFRTAIKGKTEFDVVYLLNCDSQGIEKFQDSFVIYQGHHGDRGAEIADVILPGAAFSEKHGVYVNTEGRPQLARRAVNPVGDAKDDWKILQALSNELGGPLDYEDQSDVRQALVRVVSHFMQVDQTKPTKWKKMAAASGKLSKVKFTPFIENYYQTDPISRASQTMAQCSVQLLGQEVDDVAA